jgi:hypothetical protein
MTWAARLGGPLMSIHKFTLALCLVACGTANQNPNTSAKDSAADQTNIVINPTGGSGTVLVTLPTLPDNATWAASGVNLSATSTIANSAAIALTASAAKTLPVGDYTLRVQTSYIAFSQVFSVTANDQTTLALAAVSVQYAPAVIGVWVTFSGTLSGSYVPTYNANEYIAAPAGTLAATTHGDYEQSVTNGSLTLATGDVKVLSQPLSSTSVNTVTFNQPQRQFPDVQSSTVLDQFVSDGGSYVNSIYALPRDQSTPTVLSTLEGSLYVSYQIGCQQVMLYSNSSQTINVQRIDVNDVSVANADGTTSLVAGTYNIKPVGVSGSTDHCLSGLSFPTKTGIDVPPGAYTLTVSYTVNGATQSIGYSLNLN